MSQNQRRRGIGTVERGQAARPDVVLLVGGTDARCTGAALGRHPYGPPLGGVDNGGS